MTQASAIFSDTYWYNDINNTYKTKKNKEWKRNIHIFINDLFLAAPKTISFWMLAYDGTTVGFPIQKAVVFFNSLRANVCIYCIPWSSLCVLVDTEWCGKTHFHSSRAHRHTWKRFIIIIINSDESESDWCKCFRYNLRILCCAIGIGRAKGEITFFLLIETVCRRSRWFSLATSVCVCV